MVATQVTHQTNLVDGEFTAAEATNVVTTLLREKIKFHQTERLQQWLADCNCDSSEVSDRIKELEMEMKNAREFLALAEREGRGVVISGKLDFQLLD